MILYSCDDPLVLENDTRIIVKGKVIDSNNLPISNANILVYAKKGEGIPTASDIDKKILGSNFSDSNGDFSVISVLARDDEFTVEVKANDDYTLYVYQTNTEDYVPTDLVFNIPTITLNKLATINYDIARISDEENTLQYNFRYLGDFCFEVYDDEDLNIGESRCLLEQGFGQNLTLNNPTATGDFVAPINSIVQFNYRLNGGEMQSETFTLNQEDYEFEFSY